MGSCSYWAGSLLMVNPHGKVYSIFCRVSSSLCAVICKNGEYNGSIDGFTDGFGRYRKGWMDMAHMKMKKYHGLGGMMRINMGKPVYAGRERSGSGVQGEMVNAHLKFHGNDYNAVCLSVGNPNCVFMMEEVAPRKAEGAEPYVNRMNMQLCKVADRENIVMEVYDRGTGDWLASGTGACAAAAAARRMGLADGTVTVHMQGREVRIEIAEDGTIYMTGSAKEMGAFPLAENFSA